MDKISKSRRSRNMSRIRGTNTVPERLVRTSLHKLGFRYRLHCSYLPGRPDLVFPSLRKVILVHGCFWHLHSGCENGRIPKSRVDYWRPKLLRNRSHDRAVIAKLRKLGWQVLVLWECEIERESVASTKKATVFLRQKCPDQRG